MSTEAIVSLERKENLKKHLKYWPDDMTDKEIEKAIEESGVKGRIGVKMIRSIPPLEFLNCCMNDYSVYQISDIFKKSVSIISALRNFYEIKREDLIKKGLILKPKSRAIKPKCKVEPEPESEIESKSIIEPEPPEPNHEFKDEPLIAKIITAPGRIVAGEVLGTAKMLDRLGEEEVMVEIIVRRVNK